MISGFSWRQNKRELLPSLRPQSYLSFTLSSPRVVALPEFASGASKSGTLVKLISFGFDFLTWEGALVMLIAQALGVGINAIRWVNVYEMVSKTS